MRKDLVCFLINLGAVFLFCIKKTGIKSIISLLTSVSFMSLCNNILFTLAHSFQKAVCRFLSNSRNHFTSTNTPNNHKTKTHTVRLWFKSTLLFIKATLTYKKGGLPKPFK